MALLIGLQIGCAVPNGSFARPVRAGSPGSLVVGAGVLVPFRAHGATGLRHALSGLGQAASRGPSVVPFTSYDVMVQPEISCGLGVAVWDAALMPDYARRLRLVSLAPRFEYRRGWLATSFDSHFSFIETIRDDGTIDREPLFAASVGLRGYLEAGLGGLVLTQQFGLGGPVVFVPGSVAYDLPIPIDAQRKLHVFPELRWDVTIVAGGTDAALVTFLSAGLSVGLEL